MTASPLEAISYYLLGWKLTAYEISPRDGKKLADFMGISWGFHGDFLGKGMARTIFVLLPLPAPRETDEASASPILSGMSRPHLGAIFIKGDIPDPMGLVFDLPLTADQGE